MICNQCSYDLMAAQRPLKDNNASGLRVPKRATIAYHWPRTDMEQLLCVRAIDNHQYELVNWSGGFLIDDVNVFHINIERGKWSMSDTSNTNYRTTWNIFRYYYGFKSNASSISHY